MEAPAGVRRRLSGGTACDGFVVVVPAFCWSCGVMEVEAVGGCGGLAPCAGESLRGGYPSHVAGPGERFLFRIIASYRERRLRRCNRPRNEGGGIPYNDCYTARAPAPSAATKSALGK